MNRILELRQKRAKLIADMRALVEGAATETRGMNTEEQTSWQRMADEEKGLRTTIEALEQADALQREVEGNTEQRARQERDQPNDPTAQYGRAFRSYLRYGTSEMEPELREILRGGFRREERALSTGTATAGGYTVPQGFQSELMVALKYYGGMRQSRVRVMPTAAGNDIPWPTLNDTSISGRLLGENTAITPTDATFGSVTLKAYKYSSDQILVSRELLQDASVDVEAVIRGLFAARLGRITNLHYTTGDNSSKPQGVVTASTAGKTGAAGQTLTVTYADLVALKYSVDRAYRGQAEWQMADDTFRALSLLVDANNRPLLQEQNESIAGEPVERLLGRPVIINNDVPAMAASAKSILFGDFANYVIRDVMDLTVVRMNERYADNDQVGFVAFLRTDGRAVNAGTNPIKHYANSAT